MNYTIFVSIAAVGLILGRAAGYQITMLRVEEEYGQLHGQTVRPQYKWADLVWLRLVLLGAGLGLGYFGHYLALCGIGIFVASVVTSYWWRCARPFNKGAALRGEIEYDARAGTRVIRKLQAVLVVPGLIMILFPKYRLWAGIGAIAILVIGTLLDVLLIGPAQLRRIKRMMRDLEGSDEK
jgi:hypothetical protein